MPWPVSSSLPTNEKGADRSAPFRVGCPSGYYLTVKSLLATDAPSSMISTL